MALLCINSLSNFVCMCCRERGGSERESISIYLITEMKLNPTFYFYCLPTLGFCGMFPGFALRSAFFWRGARVQKHIRPRIIFHSRNCSNFCWLRGVGWKSENIFLFAVFVTFIRARAEPSDTQWISFAAGISFVGPDRYRDILACDLCSSCWRIRTSGLRSRRWARQLMACTPDRLCVRRMRWIFHMALRNLAGRICLGTRPSQKRTDFRNNLERLSCFEDGRSRLTCKDLNEEANFSVQYFLKAFRLLPLV